MISAQVLTAILYLAEGWAEGDGGELRVYPAAGGAPVDVAPRLGTQAAWKRTVSTTIPRRASKPRDAPLVVTFPPLGTLVLFSSLQTLHRTLPLRAGSRPLVSFWFAAAEPLRLPEASRFAPDVANAISRLVYADEYTASFRDAFPADEALAAALELDAASRKELEASLGAEARAELARRRGELDLSGLRVED